MGARGVEHYYPPLPPPMGTSVWHAVTAACAPIACPARAAGVCGAGRRGAAAVPGAAQVPQALPRLLCAAGAHARGGWGAWGGWRWALLLVLLLLQGDASALGSPPSPPAPPLSPPQLPSPTHLIPTSDPPPHTSPPTHTHTQVYPERCAALPPPAFGTLLGTLRHGVGLTGDDEVTQVGGRRGWWCWWVCVGGGAAAVSRGGMVGKSRWRGEAGVGPDAHAAPSAQCRPPAPRRHSCITPAPRVCPCPVAPCRRRPCLRRRRRWRATTCARWRAGGRAWGPTTRRVGV